MRKTITGIIIIVLLVIAAVLGLGVFKFKFAIDDRAIVNIGATSPKEATYIIDGHSVTLKNGVSEVAVDPGSASKIITRYFGNEVKHDLDGDGREDVAFLLTQEMGGTGTFYYVVAALNTPTGYVGSYGLFLGDRIAPQTTEMSRNPEHQNVVLVNYADRKPGESFATQPSEGKSIWLKLDPDTMQFGEVVQNFEGEADPARMTLGMKTWNWVSTTYNNDTQVKPRDAKKFIVTFKDNGTFSATTDCNGVGGSYAVTGNKILFDKMMSTMMYCEGSQEGDFTKMLGEVQSYHFTSKGQLVFDLKFDSGSAIFR